MIEKMPSTLPEVTKKPTPEEIAALKAFISQKDEILRADTALLHPRVSNNKKDDFYTLAAIFGAPNKNSTENGNQSDISINVKDGFMNVGGVLKNV
jgi:hypothetical protein